MAKFRFLNILVCVAGCTFSNYDGNRVILTDNPPYLDNLEFGSSSKKIITEWQRFVLQNLLEIDRMLPEGSATRIDEAFNSIVDELADCPITEGSISPRAHLSANSTQCFVFESISGSDARQHFCALAFLYCLWPLEVSTILKV